MPFPSSSSLPMSFAFCSRGHRLDHRFFRKAGATAALTPPTARGAAWVDVLDHRGLSNMLTFDDGMDDFGQDILPDAVQQARQAQKSRRSPTERRPRGPK